VLQNRPALRSAAFNNGGTMLQTIAIVLVVLWALGLFVGTGLGSLIHLLLVVAVVMFAVRFFTGRKLV
jgi:hypothetical protein